MMNDTDTPEYGAAPRRAAPRRAAPRWAVARLPATWRARAEPALWPKDLPYLASLPVLVTAALGFMALSGFVLSLFYQPSHAWASLQFIDRDVNYGWLIHAFHETGTTMIFGAVFVVLFRAMFNRTYKNSTAAGAELVWELGIAQLALLLIVGWLGYTLSGGAVAYWSLANAAGGYGTGWGGGIQSWLFGGPPGGTTLGRMTAFHIVLALPVLGLALLYLAAARAAAPAYPGRKLVSFHPYYTSQYFAAFMVFALIFAVLLFFAPHLGENPMNRAPASPLVVPMAGVPPWYLLPVSAAANGFAGVVFGGILVIAKLAVLAALPWLDRSPPALTPEKKPSGAYRFLVLLLALDVILMSVAAAHTPSTIAGIFVVVFNIYYFLHFLVLTPAITAMEAA